MKEAFSVDEPRSFYISNVNNINPDTLEMIANLNFHIKYFDKRSPHVLIHKEFNKSPVNIDRYVEDILPVDVRGKRLDRNLLDFWEASNHGNSILRFILYYRMLEYAAGEYASDELKGKICDIISHPAKFNNPDRAAAEIIGLFASAKATDEIPRFDSMIERLVNGEVIWRTIEKNKIPLSTPVHFDGGYKLEPLVRQTDSFDSHDPNLMKSFSTKLRQLRNVLSHGKDIGTRDVIVPSARNLELLSPWVSLIGAATNEVLIHSRS
ncbi:hypothetical protein VSX64_10915 [Aurantimonas sp. C2-6-R+9]|uniref:hypothetical protein n=1 Tax=unclassified Aurantimonas TaxID=2638230 RepID=UPI002E18D741|nr:MULTISPECIES: hypothetical protein [unclassified Aurantimonas]MEC5291061.1 hypothetical protein [Aurantimonas sp. C2-3-R2]MEC5381390.1 hypothetical protein [Aurantimonas sp. C2-6-R+9]MEC5412212.1 hypothetical protein [Aurantimonas sp. C2-4-R8]